jgi:hypothetical protein
MIADLDERSADTSNRTGQRGKSRLWQCMSIAFADLPEAPSAFDSAEDRLQRPSRNRADSIGMSPIGTRVPNESKDPYRTQDESIDGSRNGRPGQRQDKYEQQGQSLAGRQSRSGKPLEVDQQSRIAFSQDTRECASDGSIAPTGLATSSVRDGNQSKVTGDPVPLDVDDLRNLQQLEATKGVVGPGDSVSAVGESDTSAPIESDRGPRKGAQRTTATTEKERHDMPASMSNIGKKAKHNAAIHSWPVEPGTDPDTDLIAVTRWEKEVANLVAEVQSAIKTGFVDLSAHEAWHDQAFARLAHLSSQWEDFSPDDQVRCEAHIIVAEDLINGQADEITEKEAMAEREALAGPTDIEGIPNGKGTVIGKSGAQEALSTSPTDSGRLSDGRSEISGMSDGNRADSPRSTGQRTKADLKGATETLAPERSLDGDDRPKQERSGK